MSLPRLSKVEMMILDLLRNHGELYGLQMLKKESGLKRGTIYVTLARMTDKGYVSSREMPDDRAPGLPRRLYKITAHGQQVYALAQTYIGMQGAVSYA
jgi:DNA-binding PadR family transcriptional regulator